MGKQRIQAHHQWIHPETLTVSSIKKQGWVHFDSKFEAKVYLLLRRYFAGTIEKDYPLVLSPITDNYKTPLTWKVDFKLSSPRLRNEFHIEIKGDWIQYDHTALSELRKTLRMYESQYGKENLLIVTQKSFSIDSVFDTIAYTDLVSKLINPNSLCSLS